MVTVDDSSMCSSRTNTARLGAEETVPWNGVRIMQCSYCSAQVIVHCFANSWAELLVGLSGKRFVCINLNTAAM